MYTCVYVYVFMCMCMYVCACIRVYVFMCMYVCVYVFFGLFVKCLYSNFWHFLVYVRIDCMSFQVIQMKHKDSRIKLMNEVLNGIKVM